MSRQHRDRATRRARRESARIDRMAAQTLAMPAPALTLRTPLTGEPL